MFETTLAISIIPSSINDDHLQNKSPPTRVQRDVDVGNNPDGSEQPLPTGWLRHNMNHYKPLQFLNQPSGHTVYESRKFSCFSWVSYWFLWAKTAWILDLLGSCSFQDAVHNPALCLPVYDTRHGWRGQFKRIWESRASTSLRKRSKVSNSPYWPLLQKTCCWYLLMEMLHHLIGTSSQLEGVWARWRKARFLPNLIQGEVGTIPEGRRLECCAGTLAGREQRCFWMDFGKMECQVEDWHIREEIRW